MTPACTELMLPDQKTLLADFAELALHVDSIARYLAAIETGHFVHPDGRVDALAGIALSPPQAALISHVCRHCPTPISIETGFGMGSSTAVILGTRGSLGAPFEHLAIDPYGLPDGRGAVVASYLAVEFRDQFHRIWKRSEVGLANLLVERGEKMAGLIFIDGAHHFENVMTDFTLADRLCSDGGFIVFDDAWFPAVETAINYIRCNRSDYALAHLVVSNTSVVQKRGADQREWHAFTPFPVPNRRDWTPVNV